VTITVFADFQGPFCRKEAMNLNVAALADLNARVVFRNLPLSMHPWARSAAEMAACVYRQSNDAFWELHDSLYRDQPEVTEENLNTRIEAIIAKRLDIDVKAYAACVGNRDTAGIVDRDIGFAKEHNITGTPTLFINGLRQDGVATVEELRVLVRHVTVDPTER
jgi:protein-disulfide isomerase